MKSPKEGYPQNNLTVMTMIVYEVRIANWVMAPAWNKHNILYNKIIITLDNIKRPKYAF